MLVLAAALALHFTGTTAQRLPLAFTVRNGVVRGLAVLARADCGRFGTVTEVQRFAPVRVYGGAFRAVARDVPQGIMPQGTSPSSPAGSRRATPRGERSATARAVPTTASGG